MLIGTEKPALSHPKVSVILPTHNRSDLFFRALRSVLFQTMSEIEVIVVVNACTDDTAVRLQAIDDGRIHCIHTDNLLNASSARNLAINIAKAPFLAFQDDDDIWMLNKLSRQLEAFEHADAQRGLCLSGYVRLLPGGQIAERFTRYYFDQLDFKSGVLRNNFSVIATPGWLVKTALVKEVGGFDESLPARNDWDLAKRLQDVCRFGYVEAPLFLQDQTRPTSMMYRRDLAVQSLTILSKKYQNYWAEEPETLAKHAALIGRYCLVECSKVNEARHWLLIAVQKAPFDWRSWTWLAISFFPAFRDGFIRWVLRRRG
ncbi:MAG: glycosyltransferase family 2 protein [Oceanococcus sp.]